MEKRGHIRLKFWFWVLIILIVSYLFYNFSGSPRGGVFCSDSDGGIEIFTNGSILITANGSKSPILFDKCLDDTTITEYFCKGSSSIGSQNITCPAGYLCLDYGRGAFCSNLTLVFSNNSGF